MVLVIGLDDRNAWDDTALIQSWDEALDEYKRYYSIQAQGKRLEDVLSEAELEQLRDEHGDLIEEVQAQSNAAEENNDADRQNAAQAMVEEPTGSAHQGQSSTVETSLPQHEGVLAASMPQAILGSVQDENLKNLMMSWYYAGYYTGLYTGQQQAAGSGEQEKKG